MHILLGTGKLSSQTKDCFQSLFGPPCSSTRIATIASGGAESLLWLPRPLHSDAVVLVLLVLLSVC